MTRNRMVDGGHWWTRASRLWGALFLAAAMPLASAAATSAEPEQNRGALPLEVQVVGGKLGKTLEVSQPPSIVPVRPPAGAPNVVVVLLDDVGFGATGTFGGPVPTPVLDSLAKAGLSYNRFHNTSLCSPTRAALLTGRNHHRVGAGTITEFASGYPGYDSIISKNTATIAELLKDNGYNTAAFGKWHNTPVWETSRSGPFDRWPTGMGFEEFYGFIGGESSQFLPVLYNGTTPVDAPVQDKNYHLTTDLVNHALQWVDMQHAMTPDKPFFMYFAPGATHSPHQVAESWVRPFKGKFDQGWDQLREEIFARQKALGVVPADAELTPRDPSIPAWDSLSPEQQRIGARLMEVYAGFLAQTDYEVGRLIQGLKDTGTWDNTLFIYVVGDNGGAPAGGLYGTFNELRHQNGIADNPAELARRFDEIGTAKANNNYPVGFAWALSTPFKFTKQWASHFGGTRNPMVISWPDRIKDPGTMRSQFHHVVDIVPTILEAAKLPMPASVNGVRQVPLDGVSMLYSLDSAAAPDRRHTQYFEMWGTRAIYHDGWVAATSHGRDYTPRKPQQPFGQDRWELYDLSKDFSEAHDLAAQYPDKLKALEVLFDREAVRNQVYPLNDRGPQTGGRPTLLGDRKSIVLKAGAERAPEDLIRSSFNRSFRIDADLDLASPNDTHGVVVTAGGYYGGFSLFVKDGRPMFTYNYFGDEYTTLTAQQAMPAGHVQLSYRFEYDGGGRGKGGMGRLFVNDQVVAEKRIEHTEPLGFSADETLDLGQDSGSPGSDQYEGTFPFNAAIDQVRISIQ